MGNIQTFGIAGAGVIGAGWAARALANGLDVLAWDPDPAAGEWLRETVDNAWPVMEKIGLHSDASLDRLRIVDSLETMANLAEFIQESAPERLELKTELHQCIDRVADPKVVIASSTSGLLPSEFQSRCQHPERILVGHPFNPVYLLPLVEVVAGKHTAEENVDRAIQIYGDLGMHPLRVRNEVPGFLSDRLQEALWREALHLVNDGVATPEELDAAISYGPGLRWALWGTCLIFHLAGGKGGMRQMLDHFNPSLFQWSHLEPPAVTRELVDQMARGCEEQVNGRTLREMEGIRDEVLVSILKALQECDIGAGRTLNERQAAISKSN
jgi:carnitine 3-dehydrogenase